MKIDANRALESVNSLDKPADDAAAIRSSATIEPAAAETSISTGKDLNARLKDSSIASRSSFDSQRVQDGLTRGLKSLDHLSLPSRKEIQFAKQLAASFHPKHGLADTIQLGLKQARNVSNGNLQPTARAATATATDSVKAISNNDFLNGTKEFRASLQNVRQLEGDLRKLEQQGANPADIARVRGQFQAAEKQLQDRFGYSAATAPKPGGVWVDPQFMSGSLKNGQVTASQFPTRTPVTTPPNPTDLLFRNGKTITLKTADGKDVKITNAAQYKQFVAANRAAQGMPVTDGEPVGVHLALEGGGGKGKRYSPAFASMYEQGVVPTSVSGSSAGAIAASLIAAGADPKQVDDFAKDEQLKKLFDVGFDIDGGLFNGNAAFDLFDKKLRELTGITDRPVTFADLPVPVQILATKYNDSQLPAGKEDLTKVSNRVFVFSQETTPNTPVALAVRASMAIPGVYDPVEMIDPVTGRQVELVDGGVLDNLPIGYNKNSLPTVAINLTSPNSSNPRSKDNTATPSSLPGGQLNPGNILTAGLTALRLQKAAASNAQDFRETTNPAANTFGLNLPVWNLNNPKEGDSTLKFGYDTKLDPILDQQSRSVTTEFLRNFLDDLKTPGARGSNLKPLPANLQFNRSFQLDGKNYQASYTGGDRLNITGGNGEKFQVTVGKDQIENWYIDDQAFHDMPARLQMAVRDRLS